MLHLRARWYSPSEGVFLSRDAVESEPPYQYVRGNVVNLTDASGNSPDNCECPVSQPTYMHEKARISCLDLYMIGGANPMGRYLEKESISDPAAFLTRVAVSENTNDLQDQKLVMWIIKYRIATGHLTGGKLSDLWTEVSGGGFEAFDIFRYIDEPEKTAISKAVKYNVIAGFYPYDTKLDDDDKSVKGWITAYSNAQSVLATGLKTGFPQELIINKEIKNGIVEDPANNFKYAVDAFTCNTCSPPQGRYGKHGYAGGNKYYAWYPLRSQWIWPEWNEEWPNGK